MTPQVYQGLLTLVGGALTLAVWKWDVCTPERKTISEGMRKAFSALSSPHLRTSLDYMLPLAVIYESIWYWAIAH